MRRAGLGGVTAALMLGLAAVATTRAGDDEAKEPVAKGLLSGLFHEKPRVNPAAQQLHKAIAEKPLSAPPLEAVAVQRERYKNAWMRRAEVCDRLRMIAEQTGNDTLRQQADELEERATAIYRQQTSGLASPVQAVPLTGDRQDQRAAAANSIPQRSNRGSNPIIPQPRNSATRLNGNFDQREQAILNGSSMGGE